MSRCVALGLSVVVLAVSAVRAQETRTVTLLPDDKAIVDAATVATKDIVPRLKSQNSGQSKFSIIEFRSCPKVPADTVSAVLKELEKTKYAVIFNSDYPDPRICAR
jgi:hypothetical protein